MHLRHSITRAERLLATWGALGWGSALAASVAAWALCFAAYTALGRPPLALALSMSLPLLTLAGFGLARLLVVRWLMQFELRPSRGSALLDLGQVISARSRRL